MAITDIIEETELTAGAPSIKYEGDMNPNQGSGIMEMASMESGQEGTLEEIYFELIADGMDPEAASIKAREIYNNMSSQPQDMMQEPRTMAAYGGIMGVDGRRGYVGGSYSTNTKDGSERGSYQGRDDSGGYSSNKNDYSGSNQGADDRSNAQQTANNDAAVARGRAEKAEADRKAREQKAEADKKKAEEKRKKETKKVVDAQTKKKKKTLKNIVTDKDLDLFDKNKDGKLGLIERFNRFTNTKNKELAAKRSFQKYQDVEQYVDPFDDYGLSGKEMSEKRGFTFDGDEVTGYDRDKATDYGYDFSDPKKGLDKGLATLTSNKGTSLEKTRKNLYDVNSPIPFSPLGNKLVNKIRPDTQVTAMNTLNKAADYSILAGQDRVTQNDLRDLRNLGRTEDQIKFIEEGRPGGDNVPIIIPTTKKEEAEEEEPFQLGLAFRADGGRVGKAYGGSMGDDGRRAYGLGSIFKKIKKVFKSPLGKAALLGLGGYGLSGGLGGSSFMQGLKSQGLSGLLKKAGSYALKNPGVVIPAASAAAALFTDEEDEDTYVDNTGIDVKKIRANPYEYLARANRAEGGPMGGEIMEGESEELLDMNGMEKDYREDGGFVPIGEYEKKDDVPARLSKNEFVFTADAVRGAGEGDVDLGAEKLYTQMKELESVGKRMQGANEMFQTSQRLEEVI
jgi:hypothetical protein